MKGKARSFAERFSILQLYHTYYEQTVMFKKKYSSHKR